MLGWLLGDLVRIFNPAFPMGPSGRARWLIIIGVFLTLFGAIGVAAAATTSYETQGATIVGRQTHKTRDGTNERVRVRLDDGDVQDLRLADLFRDIGEDTNLPATAEVDTTNDQIKTVHFHGRRYGTGYDVAIWVVPIIIGVFGFFLLLRGIGRRRWLRLQG